MAPGPPDKFSNNRFSVLGDFIDNPSKKKKSNEFPELPTTPCVNPRNNPKYVLISSSDPKKQLSQISPFVIKKGVESISTEFDSISLLRDGNLLILTRNARVADKFLKTKHLSNVCPITCKLHDSLNSVKGVIYAPCLISVTEKEIVEEMKDQAVIDIYKFTKPSEDGKSRVPTGKMVITFDLYRLPKTVDVAWYKCKVDFYIPNPMRCTNCQKLGHTKNHCKGDPTCPTCSLPPHVSEDCTRIFCTNCSGDHSSADKNCPRFLQIKEVLKYKTENYCSIGEARRKLKENIQPPATSPLNTYASTVTETPTKRKEAISNHSEKNDKQTASTIVPNIQLSHQIACRTLTTASATTSDWNNQKIYITKHSQNAAFKLQMPLDHRTFCTKSTKKPDNASIDEFRAREEKREEEFEQQQRAKAQQEEDEKNAKLDAVRTQILEAALLHVPTLGWTRNAIVKGAEETGYPSVVHGMFPEGGFDLVSYFNGKCNKQLLQMLQQETNNGTKVIENPLEFLVRFVRLRLEMIVPYKGQWSQAIALIAMPQNAHTALAQVLTLVDDICYYSGDRSVDIGWYTRRIGLATIMKMTELYMLQDNSAQNSKTWEFLQNRMDEAVQLQSVLQQTEGVKHNFQKSFNSAFITARNILGLNYNRS